MENTLNDDLLCFLENENKNENDLQRFLEVHSRYLVPEQFGHGVMHTALISKFPLGVKYKTDYVYLCKDTVHWTLYLVELEDARKPLIRSDGGMTSELTQAIGQIHDWKYYIDSGEGKVFIKSALKRFLNFNPTFGNNPINFKYILVIGRSNKRMQEYEKKIRYTNATDDMLLLTYDSLINNVRWNNQWPKEYAILTLHDGDKFKVKYIPDNLDTSLFTYLKPNELGLDSENRKKLINFGYDIEEWEKGHLLVYNNKGTEEKLMKRFFR